MLQVALRTAATVATHQVLTAVLTPMVAVTLVHICQGWIISRSYCWSQQINGLSLKFDCWPTFAGLSVWIQRESTLAVAAEAPRRVLADAVAAAQIGVCCTFVVVCKGKRIRSVKEVGLTSDEWAVKPNLNIFHSYCTKNDLIRLWLKWTQNRRKSRKFGYSSVEIAAGKNPECRLFASDDTLTPITATAVLLLPSCGFKFIKGAVLWSGKKRMACGRHGDPL